MKKGPNTLGYKGSTKVEDQDNLTILPSYNMQYVTHQIGGKITSAQSLLDTTIETEFLDKEFSNVLVRLFHQFTQKELQLHNLKVKILKYIYMKAATFDKCFANFDNILLIMF